MASLSSVYQEKQKFYQGEIDRRSTTLRRLVWGRIAVALIFIAALYGGFSQSLFFYTLPLVALLFLFLVQRYGKETMARNLATRLEQLNALELRALEYDFQEFDPGENFKDEHHPFSYDLDLFGKGSLFQYINRSASQVGEQRLADDLLKGGMDPKKIYQRQEAVRELGPQLDLRQRLWATGKGVIWSKSDLQPLFEWLREPDWVRGNKKFFWMRWVLPVFPISALVYTYIDFSFLVVFIVLMSLQLAIISIYSGRVSKMMMALTHYRDRLDNYGQLFQLFRQGNFQSDLLKQHGKAAQEAHEEVKRFAKLVNALESRMNPIANAFGNGIFALDLHSVFALEEWRAKSGQALPQWLQSLAEWDALNSLAQFHFTNPGFAFPAFTEQLSLKAVNLGHPLIPPAVRVDNDFSLRTAPQVMVITGANMAGKSTFLRAVGVNYVLSLSGAPVCADRWEGPIVALRSGMRTTDSLQDHQSYFYAELSRLRSIMQELKNGTRTLVLLDEILKGTNSDDKQTGSRELILEFVGLPCLVLLATHDVVLGGMADEKPEQIAATCFESEIRNEGLYFDYRLKPGVAKTRNATYLMRQMGIIPGSKGV